MILISTLSTIRGVMRRIPYLNIRSRPFSRTRESSLPFTVCIFYAMRFTVQHQCCSATAHLVLCAQTLLLPASAHTALSSTLHRELRVVPQINVFLKEVADVSLSSVKIQMLKKEYIRITNKSSKCWIDFNYFSSSQQSHVRYSSSFENNV